MKPLISAGVRVSWRSCNTWKSSPAEMQPLLSSSIELKASRSIRGVRMPSAKTFASEKSARVIEASAVRPWHRLLKITLTSSRRWAANATTSWQLISPSPHASMVRNMERIASSFSDGSTCIRSFPSARMMDSWLANLERRSMMALMSLPRLRATSVVTHGYTTISLGAGRPTGDACMQRSSRRVASAGKSPRWAPTPTGFPARALSCTSWALAPP
mmetsp:Transcript_67047/g.196071  ORF Transcript_67047/g.196071 Transcript_67047/m.196071 type:complete len:216 (+) Transcript_67047:825-1472(+)